jgi:hypothetical protein
MKRLATAFLILALIPAAAVAKDKKAGNPPPAVFQAVIDCRTIGDSAARLACYDGKVATLAEAQKSDDLFVASKDDVRKARRGLFGLSLPKFGFFGGGGDDDTDKTAIKEIDAVIANVGRGQGGWSYTLDDGAVWVQTDNVFTKSPQPGQKIHIRRGALGSFFATVAGGLAVRVKRENR